MADCGLCPKSFLDVKKVCEHFETDHLGDIKNDSNDSGIYGVLEMELDEDFFSKSIFREDFFAKNNSKKRERKSSSEDSGDHFEQEENHKKQQQTRKENGGKFEFENNSGKDKLLPYLQLDLNEDAELIAEKMVEGVNIPG